MRLPVLKFAGPLTMSKVRTGGSPVFLSKTAFGDWMFFSGSDILFSVPGFPIVTGLEKKCKTMDSLRSLSPECSPMTFEEENDTLRCVFSGDMDTRSCSEAEEPLGKKVSDFMKNRDVTYLVFDLTDVRYICSAFLRLCLFHCKAVGSRNFRIENPSTEVNRVFQISGFTEIMNIV